MGVVNPEIGAIKNYLWVSAQSGIAHAIELVKNSQVAINPDYDFEIYENKYQPALEKVGSKAFVNILIDSVDSMDDTNFGKTHIVTYNIDCYVRGENEENPEELGPLVPADQVAVQRLYYLCAMVEFALTKLANFNFGIDSGDVVPGKIRLSFDPVSDAGDSLTPYAPARLSFDCKFPYEAQDLENLPELQESCINFEDWASEFIYN